MRHNASHDLAAGLQQRLAGASRIAVVGIGDELSPYDRLGMLAAKEIRRQRLPGIRVFLAGTVPESITGPIRASRPDHVLLLDAADMSVRPGTIGIIRPGTISAGLFSTHVLPLSVVMEYIEKDAQAKVTLLGIQPDLARPESGLSEEDHEFLDRNLDRFKKILRTRRISGKNSGKPAPADIRVKESR